MSTDPRDAIDSGEPGSNDINYTEEDEKIEIFFKVGPTSEDIGVYLGRRVCANLGYNQSVHGYMTYCIEEECGDVLDLVGGLKLKMDFIDWFSNFDYTMVDIPNLGIGDLKFDSSRERSKAVRVETDDNIVGTVDEIARFLDSPNSVACRACFLKCTYDILETKDHDFKLGSRARRIKRNWNEFRMRILQLHNTFDAFIKTRFVDGYENTIDTFEMDPGEARYFALDYKDLFKDSVAYDTLEEEQIEHIEKVIEETTDIDLDE